jgi:hypothetical protein
MQRDYLKWRGTLFHRFLLALVDESEKIRQLADFLFGSILKSIDTYQIDPVIAELHSFHNNEIGGLFSLQLKHRCWHTTVLLRQYLF